MSTLKRLRRESQEKIRHIKDSWWNAKAEELQHYADQHASKQFFEGQSICISSTSDLAKLKFKQRREEFAGTDSG